MRGFEFPSGHFHLSPDIDEGFTLARSGEARILKVDEHEIKFGTQEEIHALLEVLGVSPPMSLGEGVSFDKGFGFCFGEIKDVANLLFEEEDLFDRSSSVDVDHLGDQKMFFFGPPIYMFEESPFHLPEFFSMKGPALSLERFRELD
jgi:hypothetical protein